MKTRFDRSDRWCTSKNESTLIKEMDTAHLMNTVKMLVQKPDRSLSMLIADIESANYAESVWTVHNTYYDDRKLSLHNVTSLSTEELVSYVMGTPSFSGHDCRTV